MSWTFQWYDDAKTILMCDIRERWTWDEAHQIAHEQGEWIETAGHKVHSIFVLHDVSSIPQGGSALANIRRLMGISHPNEALSIYVGLHNFGQRLVDIVSNVYGLRELFVNYRFVRTLEEALWEIGEYDKTHIQDS